ncbi:MAG: hypothetical protein JRI39_00780 [Deltaproteobacteria bacterium]|nr:hypothetical protein [Deltaproteobacteria bacterium]
MGLCKVSKHCYAYADENTYRSVERYRNRQQIYWRKKSAREITADLAQIIAAVYGRYGFLIDKIRFNESGDFFSQRDVYKLNFVTENLRGIYPHLIVYGYTARYDLDYRGIVFRVKFSGYPNGPWGSTYVMPENQIPKGSPVCPGSCKKCSLCATSAADIIFPLRKRS